MKNTCLVLTALLFLFSQAATASIRPSTELYNFYFSETTNKHFRGGLVGSIESCRSLNYQPCKNRFDGFKFKTVTGDTALFLAALAKDYSLGLHSRAQTLMMMNQILDAWDRLSRYSSDQSQFLVSQIHHQNISQMLIEFLVRRPLILQMSVDGFMIREDLGEDFDRFAATMHSSSIADTFSDVRPETHDVISVLFGLVSAKKYVSDANLQFKISQLSRQIFDYLSRSDFFIENPKTGYRYKGKSNLNNAKYPILVSLQYLINEDVLKPKASDFGNARAKWLLSSAFELRMMRFRCDENLLLGIARRKKCNYLSSADQYLLAGLVSFETNDELHRKNVSFFKKTFLHKRRISKEQNPLLAAIAVDYYDQPKTIELASALQNLETAPAQTLPNTWAKPWVRVFEKPINFVKNQEQLPPDSNSETGTEFPGTDYLMPFVYSAFHQ